MNPSSIDVRLFWYAFLLYLVAFVAFSVYAATRRRLPEVLANAALAAGFALHSTGIGLRWYHSGHAPMANMYEYASLLSWMAVLSYLWIAWRYRRSIVGAFVAPVVVALMTCASLLPKEMSQQLVPALQSYWLAIHVSLAALGEGAFAVAFAVSIMYLVQDVRSRRRAPELAPAALRPAASRARVTAAAVPGGVAVDGEEEIEGIDFDVLQKEVNRGDPAGTAFDRKRDAHGATRGHAGGAAAGRGRLPSLQTLDEINYRATTIGYPLYTIGALFAGAIWAYNAWGTFWSWDPKEVGAFIIWLFYTAYLHARLQRSWAGRRAAWLSIAGFSMVVLSFLGNLWLGGNHAYK